MQPTLLSTFLDCAPAALSPAGYPSETELRMVLVVAEIARSLYGDLLLDISKVGGLSHGSWCATHMSQQSNGTKGKIAENLSAILGYMSPYFPFTAGGLSAAKRDIKVCCFM